jgi:hypothetical protein
MVLIALRPLELYCDNNKIIARVKESRSHKKLMHILRKYHLIREIIKRDNIKIYKVDTKANMAKLLIKSLSRISHTMHKTGMRHPIHMGLAVRFESCTCDVVETTNWLDIFFMHVDLYEIDSSSSEILLVLM